MRASQHNANRCVEFFPEFGEAPAADPCHKMRACNVEVAEVRAIRLVDVPIALIPGGSGPYDERLEEGSGRDGRRKGASCAVELADEGVENANVPSTGKDLEVQQCIKDDKELPQTWAAGKTDESAQSRQA